MHVQNQESYLKHKDYGIDAKAGRKPKEQN